MKFLPKIVVITGAESTGKSTLAESLALHYKVPYIREIARDYVESLNRNYNYNDIIQIAKSQVEILKGYKDSKHPFIFVDTWLIITKIWFEKVYNLIPDWLIEEIKNTEIDLFLLCDIDLPWEYDPIRENGGIQREILHKTYIEELKRYNFKYKIVSGQNEARLKKAIQIIDLLK